MEYDPLWEENPRIKEDRVRSEAEGLRSAVVTVVRVRFPELAELAQQKVA